MVTNSMTLINYLNGWKTKDDIYFENVKSASKNINSKLFRPPYGKIKKFQAMLLQKAGYKIIMWDVLCGDFDQIITKEKCLENVILSSKSGSIIVFHDSEKAFKKLEFALPKVLAYFTNEGYKFESLKIEP